MCGRAVRRTPAREIAKLFSAQMSSHQSAASEQLEEQGPAFNLAPTQALAAVRLNEEGERELVGMRWGLLPPWAKKESEKRPPMLNNARAETVTEKRSFSSPFQKGRRCLVIFDGFYEWLRTDKKNKRPFFFQNPEQKPIAMAGLWQYNKSFDLVSGTVLTCAANALMEPVHGRMPCILDDPEAQRHWLDAKTPEPKLLDLLTPLKEDRLICFEVSSFVNSVKNQGEECLQPAEPPLSLLAGSASTEKKDE